MLNPPSHIHVPFFVAFSDFKVRCSSNELVVCMAETVCGVLYICGFHFFAWTRSVWWCFLTLQLFTVTQGSAISQSASEFISRSLCQAILQPQPSRVRGHIATFEDDTRTREA
jgi:hypothetical protein